MAKQNDASLGVAPLLPQTQPHSPMWVDLAFLQTAITLPGLITSDSTLSAAKVKGLSSMEWTPEGLVVSVGARRAIIPLANVKVARLSE